MHGGAFPIYICKSTLFRAGNFDFNANKIETLTFYISSAAAAKVENIINSERSVAMQPTHDAVQFVGGIVFCGDCGNDKMLNNASSPKAIVYIDVHTQSQIRVVSIYRQHILQQNV